MSHSEWVSSYYPCQVVGESNLQRASSSPLEVEEFSINTLILIFVLVNRKMSKNIAS